MNNWQKSLGKFISEYQNEPYVVGAILCGSYANGTNNESSDIDAYIITDNNQTWRERGNKLVDGYLIEYFINPIKKCEQYLSDEYNDQEICTTTMFTFGKILFDKTGEVRILQELARNYFDKPFKPYDDFKLQDGLYHCWDSIDELKSLFNNNQYIDGVYHLLLQRLINVYYYKNGISTIPLSKMERIYKDKEFRTKYHLKNEPKQEFIDLVISCMTTVKKLENIIKLYDYVIEDCGGFDINKFKLRSDI